MIDWDDQVGSHRRTENSRSGGLRHDVAIPARIEGMTGSSMDAEINDVSSGGMSLRIPIFAASAGMEILPVGSKVIVIFAPDHKNTPDDTVRLSAEIARRNPPFVGVHFVEMNLQQRRALGVLAALSVHSRTISSNVARDPGAMPARELDARPILVACLKVIERRLPNIIWTLRTELVTQLRLLNEDDSRKFPGNAKEQADLIDEKGTAIGRTIERRIIQSFAELGGLDSTRELVFTRQQIARAKQQAAADKLGLVEEKTLERSIAMDTTAKRMDTTLTGKSFDVNVRLANVLRRRIDNIENPLAPAVMCCMLWESVTEFCDSPRVHVCLQRAMIRHIMPLLSDLYDALEKTLDEKGVPNSYWTGEGNTP